MKLNLHKISVGNSYECDKSEDVVLCNDAAKNTDLSNITLAQTHWEAFGMNGSQKFNDGEKAYLTLQELAYVRKTFI